MLKWLLRIVGAAVALIAAGLVWLKLTHGRGEPYPDLSGPPVVAAERISEEIEAPFPPGMVTAAPDGRIFYTLHMMHKPERFTAATLFEWRDGAGVPFPTREIQPEFYGAMGLSIDRQDRLWVITPGALEGERTRLLAVDMVSGAIVLDHRFAEGEAGFAQDLRVAPDGKTVYLADTGLFRFADASLIVFDVETRTARTILKGHPSVAPQNWVIRRPDGAPHRLALGLVTFTAGVNGIALSEDGEQIYFAAMSHDSLYRVPTEALRDPEMTDEAIAEALVLVGKKPLSDGIARSADGSILITDIENGGLAEMAPDGTLRTLTKDPAVDWANSVAVAPDGAIWFTDGRITDLIDQFAQPSDEATMRDRGPYAIYRIAP